MASEVINLAERREQKAAERDVAEILALSALVAEQLMQIDAETIFGFGADRREYAAPASVSVGL